MVPMKFAEKCPKCGGFVQTKSVRKSIGLGFVEIPVAQFCLNPVCDWYQDFAEAKKPEDIKEGYQPAISKNQMIALAAIIGLIVIFTLFTYFLPVNNASDNPEFLKPQPTQSELQQKSNTVSSETPKIPTVAPTTVFTSVINETKSSATPAIIEPKNHTIKIDVSHGFYPDVIAINKSDTIIWSNEENQRARIVLVSKDGLFEKHLLQYPGRYQYQFNQKGKYSFILADYEPHKEYPNATGSVIVR